MPADCCYLGDGIAIVRLKTGRKMYVETTDTVVVPHLLLDGEWETWVSQIVYNHLRPGDTFVDVGAHCGWYSLLAAERVGPKGAVVALEPQRRLAGLLRRSAELNGFSNVTVIAAAASSGAGTAYFRQPTAHSGWGHVMADVVPEEKRFGDEYRIATQPLDQVVDSAALIKIDAEMHEREVLAGARALIARCHPTLLIEHHPELAPHAHLAELVTGGYTMKLVTHESSLEPLELEALARVPDSEMLLFSPPKSP